MLASDFQVYNRDLPYVTSKEIYINGNTEKFHTEGLYSEVIFGPKKAYQCTCGALHHKSNEGEICDICGVTCDDGSRRKEQYAKIKLKKKVLLPVFEKAMRNIIGIRAFKDLFAIQNYKQNLIDPFYCDILNGGVLKKRKAIKKLEETVFDKIPIYDIASLNRLFDFLIEHPVYRLIVAAKINPNHFKFVFVDEILVFPPETRPIVMTGQKKDIPDISKFYRTLLASTTGTFWEKYGQKQEDTTEATDATKTTEDTGSSDSVPQTEVVTEVSKKKNKYQNMKVAGEEEYNKSIYYIQKIVNELYQTVFTRGFDEKTSTLRESINGATVEYSARATIIPEPAIKPFAVGLAKDTVTKIMAVNIAHFLYTEIEVPRRKAGDNSPLDPNYDVFHLIGLLSAGKYELKISDELFDKFVKNYKNDLIVMIERAPVLWRFNFSGVVVEVIIKEEDGYAEFSAVDYIGPRLSNTTMYNNKVMMVNTTIAAAFNLDFDGDNMSIYAIHSNQAKKDFYNAFLGNGDNIKFEHNNQLVSSPEHESIYALWALTNAVKTFKLEYFTDEDKMNAFEFNAETTYINFKLLNTHPMMLTKFINDVDLDGNETFIYLPYAIACINKALKHTLIKENPGPMPKKRSKKLMKELLEVVGKDEFYNYFHEYNKFLLMASTMVGYCNPTFSLKDFAIISDEIMSYKETLINEPFIGFHQNDILFLDYVKPEIAKDQMNSLHRVSESDARIKSVQLLKAASNNGIPTDIHGRAFIKNIKEDLLTGHTKEGFFQSGDSARLALAQRQEAIPKGGELQRRFYWITGFLKLAKVDNCGTKRTFPIYIRSKSHLETLHGRWYVSDNRIMAEHNILKNNNLVCLDIDDPKSGELIGKTIEFRSPIYCEQPGFKICDKCMGTQQTKSINLGAAIGSYIPEAIIQSVLRTHHFSGAFITKVRNEIIELIKRNRFESPNIIFCKDPDEIKKLKLFYDEVYPATDDVSIDRDITSDTETELAWRINVKEAPYNDDSVKQLNKIIQILDKDRNEDTLMPIEEMYNNLLDEIVLPNGIFSIYIELIMSLMFYDENDTIIRYGGEVDHQSALKKVINKCDPRLSLFYNLNSNAVSLILKDSHKILGAEHMLSGLLSLYKK